MNTEMRIQNVDKLISHGNLKGRRIVAEILEAGLKAADPYNNVRKLIRKEGNNLIIGCREYQPKGDKQSTYVTFDLNKIGSIYVVGAAKGVQRAAKAIEDILGDRLTGGHVIPKKGDQKILKRIGVTFGAHPVPDADCVKGSEKIYEITQKVKKGDLVFTISGNGGSSLLTLPAPGISIEDVREVTYKMQIERGVPTQDLNTIRNHIDLLKVGRLSMLMKPAFQVHILMWDAGDPLPTKMGSSSYDKLLTQNLWLHALPDQSTFADAVRVIDKWDAWNDIPPSIRRHLETADPRYESPKREDFEKLSFRIFGILPRRGALFEAKKKIEDLGYRPVVLTEWMQAEAKDAGRVVAQIAKNIENTKSPFTPPCVLMSTGELLVTVGENNGIGGRNQEFLLSAALEIVGSKKIVMGAVDTDGTDGPGTQFIKGHSKTPCLAGGIVDGYTMESASKKGIDIVDEIKRHNTTIPLLKLNDGVIAKQSVSLGDLAITFISDR
ncbi:MAG: DUF4147 domain-containing protein [Nitrososphaeria archaeon]|jgi:glycerate-2-kinase